MCIVSLCQIQNEWVLTHTRDENIFRPFENEVQTCVLGKSKVRYLKDSPSAGTWFLDSDSYISCLINGGKEKPLDLKPMPNSRGKVLFELIKRNSLDDFLEINYCRYAPFSTIVFDKNRNTCMRISWNGESIQKEAIQNQFPYLMLSTTLYSQNQFREKYTDFKQHNFERKEDVTHWHIKHKMQQGEVSADIKSVCLAQISFEYETKVTNLSFELVDN